MNAQWEMISHSIPTQGQQAMPLGNGKLGAMVWLPGQIRATLNHAEAWVPGSCQTISSGQEDVFRLFNLGSVASVSVELDPFPFTNHKDYRQVLELMSGRLVVEQHGVRLEARVERSCDALILQLTGYRGIVRARLNRWRAEDQLFNEGSEIIQEHQNRSSPWKLMNQRVGLESWNAADPFRDRRWSAVLRLPKATFKRNFLERKVRPEETVSLVVTVAVGWPKGDATRDARLLQRRLQASDAVQLFKAHRAAWAALWRRSDVSIQSAEGSAEKLQQLWRLHLYQVLASLSPDHPGKANGGLFLTEPDQRPWGGHYWFQNLREIYWSLIGAGHPELMQAFVAWPRRTLDFLQAQTPRLFAGCEGAYIPETMSFWGWADFADLASGYRHPYIDYNLSTGPEWAWQMWWSLQATGDTDSLTRNFLPVTREVIRFLRSFARLGTDGRFHFAPANSLETYWKVADPLPLLAALRRVLPIYLALGTQHQEPVEVLRQANELLERLPAFRRGRLVFADAPNMATPNLGGQLAGVGTTGDGSKGPQCRRIVGIDRSAPGWLPAHVQAGDYTHNWENPSLYAIYPFGYGAPGSAEHADALASFRHREQPWPWLGWSQDAIQAARLGLAEEACRLALFHARANQKLRFGGFINVGNEITPNLDASGVAAATLSEMLVQDREEGLCVLPATPKSWHGEFRLHSRYGVEVRCRFENGRVQRVVLTAKRGTRFRFRHPGSARWLSLKLAQGETWAGK